MNVWFLLEKSRIDQQSLEEYYTKNPIYSLSEFIEKINDKLNKIGFSVKQFLKNMLFLNDSLMIQNSLNKND